MEEKAATPKIPVAKQIQATAKYRSSAHKGRMFERFVFEMIFQGAGKDNFELIRKTSDFFNRELQVGDKTNKDPDFLILHKKSKKQFAVECKYRTFREYDEISKKPFIEWCAEYQLKNYQEFQKSRRIPVFVVIGIGGTPDKPFDVYCIPLRKLKSTILFDKDLKNTNKGKRKYFRLYWDEENKNLVWDRPDS